MNEETSNSRLDYSSVADHEDEIHYLSEKAPFFAKILAKSHVNPGAAMWLPLAALKMLPCTNVPVVLKYGGKNWTVYYTRDIGRPRFGCQWKNFAVDNHLKPGDACVFELIDPSRTNPILKVHILRGDLPPELLASLDVHGKTADSPIIVD